jgi:hypothetical protein
LHIPPADISTGDWIVNVKNTAPAAVAAERHIRAEPHYMQLAATNIEDFDRAMRSAVAASKRSGTAAEPVEREVTA